MTLSIWSHAVAWVLSAAYCKPAVQHHIGESSVRGTLRSPRRDARRLVVTTVLGYQLQVPAGPQCSPALSERCLVCEFFFRTLDSPCTTFGGFIGENNRSLTLTLSLTLSLTLTLNLTLFLTLKLTPNITVTVSYLVWVFKYAKVYN